MTSHTLAELIV